ncbi:hypothetical protein [Paraburkholderia dinghuensis]|nr:hypothetical protein [Paraburkholderia dinghuensis]
MHMYEDGMRLRNANYTPLTAVDFLVRALDIDTEYASVAQVVAEAQSCGDLIAHGDANFQYLLALDKGDTIAFDYKSGTTGNPRGVVYPHRAYLTATSHVLELDLAKPSDLPVDAAHTCASVSCLRY